MSELETERHQSITLDAREFNVLEGASDGLEGKGTFSFKVVGNPEGERYVVQLMNIKLETENNADRELKKLVGDTNNPPEGVSRSSQDDDIDIY